MIWFRDLLLGVFTRHLGTKLLALLLSLGLFGFVQTSLRATHEIRQLTLQFSLVPQLRTEQAGLVLLRDEVTLQNLLISGMRDKVDPLAKLYAAKSTVNLEIDQRFLSRYGEEFGEKTRVRISRDLLQDDALFGRDVTVGEFNEPVVELDKLATKDVRVEVDTTAMPAAITNPDHQYAGTKLNLSVNVKSVSLQGPLSAFTTTGLPVILVSVDGIEDELSRVQVTGEQGMARLTEVEISWKGIVAELLPRMRVTAPALASAPMSVQEFRKRLVVSCEVMKKKVDKTLSDVPIEIRYPAHREFDLRGDYQDGVTFLDTDLKDGLKQELKVRLPLSLAENQDFLNRLVIVLNVAAASEDPQAKILAVPYRLDLKHPAGVDDAANLALVEILLPGGAGAPQAIAEFRRKE